MLAATVAALAAAPAHAEQQTALTLVDPTTALTQEPPLAPPAANTPREQEATAFHQRVDSQERITTGVDATGRPVSVAVAQRLHVVGTGDYSYTVPAPVLSVQATSDSESAPGRRTGAILWAGFSDGARTLGADARLQPAAAAPYLPLRLGIRAEVDGSSLRAGERRSGTLSLVLTLYDATRTPAPSASARADLPALVRALDEARRGVYPLGGVTIHARGPVAARTAAVEAPLDVRGEIMFQGGHVAGLHGGRMRFSARLGDGGPLTRTIRFSGPATGVAAPRVRIVARPVEPMRSLVPPRGATWADAARRGPRLDSRRLLTIAEDAHLRAARAHQYDTFLANPGPPRESDGAEYVYVTAPAPAAMSMPGRRRGQGLVLMLALVVIVAGGGLVAWAHL
ncbi:hypothetical protein [Candidatus Solirubrobacter pratensis]|uniref:hypothetical protein n=1 Tax=Candidatus Solirubrobacter pratensis TaxID=1298857 RepID=UPI0004820A11|nr:hypothetical protein [Candidatus Solirubrobacter pratensis]